MGFFGIEVLGDGTNQEKYLFFLHKTKNKYFALFLKKRVLPRCHSYTINLK